MGRGKSRQRFEGEREMKQGACGSVIHGEGMMGARHNPLSVGEREALNFILPLSPEYPGIEAWFLGKVVPGLHNGSRKILRFERHGRLVALGIGKMEPDERKICTVRVSPEYFGRGLGLRVFDELMSWMGTDVPHATLSKEKLPEFRRIFERYGFALTSAHDGRYRPGKIELLFNEPGTPRHEG
jgi:hypothetical protein